MENKFTDILKGKVVIVGVGNILRGDDAFGPTLIEKLSQGVDLVCIDAGTAPENYIGKIAKNEPDTILIVDAVDLGKPAGEFEILTKQDILNSGFSTHDLSPRMFIDFLGAQTKAAIYLLGVQPQNLSLGASISPSLKISLEKITELIKEASICTKHI